MTVLACSGFKTNKQTINLVLTRPTCSCARQHQVDYPYGVSISILHVHNIKAQIYGSDTQNFQQVPFKDRIPCNIHSATAFYSGGAQFKPQPEYRLQSSLGIPQLRQESSGNFFSTEPHVAPPKLFPTVCPPLD